MGKKQILFTFTIILFLSAITEATTIQFCDDFEDDWDYFMGTEGTIWDGIIGLGYCIYINTFDPNDNVLNIRSANSSWPNNGLGVLLYKEAGEQFSAKVAITDAPGLYGDPPLIYSQCGLMARVGDPDAAGPGEDWIAIIYNSSTGYLEVVSCDNGETPIKICELIWPPIQGVPFQTFIQIERYDDDTFVCYYSTDGLTWQPFPVSPIIRTDLTNLPLQVGPHHAVFGGTDAWAEYDNFCLERNAIEKAYSPLPTSGGWMDLMDGILSWHRGDFAVEHRVYFSSDFNDVNNRVEDANRGTDRVIDEGGGRFSYDAGYYEANDLAFGQTYYWCIDEINDVCEWAGDVWRFTVQYYSTIDNFKSYSDTGKLKPPPAGTLKRVWVDGNYAFKLFPQPTPGTSGSLVQLNIDTHDGVPSYTHYQPEDIAQSYAKSMKFYYDNDGTVTWEVDLYDAFPPDIFTYTPSPDTNLSEAYAAVDDAAQTDPELDSLDMKRDWSGYKVLKLSFYGDPNNDINNISMYAGLEDGSGNLAVIHHPDANCIINNLWQDWCIELQDFADVNDVNLTDIAKIYIGFGDKNAPKSGGSGVVFFDDIKLCWCSEKSAGDLNDDCMVNFIDFAILANEYECLECGCLRADLYEDGKVDLMDLDILLDDWMKEVPLGD